MRDEDFICVRHKLERQFSSLSYGSMCFHHQAYVLKLNR